MGTYLYGQTIDKIELIWVDANVNNEENQSYKEEILKLMSVNLSCFENVIESIDYLKKLKFTQTYIISSGSLYCEFIKEFKASINELSICPKIIVFCGDKKSFIQRNKNNPDISINHPFFNSGGIQDRFNEVKEFLLKKEDISIEPNSFEIIYSDEDKDKFNFEYILDQNQLIIPLFLFEYMKKPPEEEIQNFNNLCFKNYIKINELKALFEQLIEIKNIPIEILYKYWLKAFSFDNNFHKDLNEELKSNNKKYFVFILAMYEGVKRNKIPLEISDDTNLYRYSYLSKDKLDNMETILNKKKENLPSILIYCKHFLSFYFNEQDALNNNKNTENNVILIIENAKQNLSNCIGYTTLNDYNINKNNEIIIFPFLFFEILKIEKTNENSYKIYLGLLDKYKNLFTKEDKKLLVEKIPKKSATAKELFIPDIIDEEYMEMYNILEMKYKINSYDKDFNVFGEIFVKNNKDKCYMICHGQKSEITEKYRLSETDKSLKELMIKLVGLNKVTDLSHLFDGSRALISIDNFSMLKTDKITNMSSIFKWCSNLITLPDISNWNTSNVTDMSYLFAKCSSVEKLPNISKWDTSNVINMCSIFDSCSSLISLPDISNWNLKNVKDMSFMFYDLPKLETFPDISKWNTENAENMSSLFEKCSNPKIVSLPDISKWNVEKVTDISCMFYCCKSLESLPDISKWNIKNISKMEYTFFGLKDSIKIPEQFKTKK